MPTIADSKFTCRQCGHPFKIVNQRPHGIKGFMEADLDCNICRVRLCVQEEENSVGISFRSSVAWCPEGEAINVGYWLKGYTFEDD